MSVDHDTGHTYDHCRVSVDDVRNCLDRRLDDPPTFCRPERWTFTKAWHRAQTDDKHVASRHNPARYIVLLGDGDVHDVLFAIYDGELRADCDCGAYQHHYDGIWRPHVALLWFRWAVYGMLVVTDLDADDTHVSPPPWLRVDKSARQLPARADGGEKR